MIDTDKYEGHAEGPWKITCFERKWYVDDGNDDDVCRLWGTAQRKNPTARLIAAAPDLLAEVERLRMYEVGWKILYDNAREEERETRTRTWKEIMELVRSDVREMVDESYPCFDEWLNSSIGGFE